MKYDVVILGTGVIGASIAYRLAKYDAKILVIDKENDVANVVSAANSAIVHTGHDPKDGTLKALLNAKGAKMYESLAKDLDIHYKKIGALTVMVSTEQEPQFNALIERAKKRNIVYKVLSGDEARNLEPNLSDNVIKAISFPDTAIISPWEYALASLEVAKLNGVDIMLNTELEGVEVKDTIHLHTSVGDIETTYFINAGGLSSDKISRMYSDRKEEIIPKRGEYFVLSHNAKDFVKQVIYPIPTSKGKGVLAIPTVHENILLGPNSEVVDSIYSNDTSLEGMNYVRTELSNTLKNIPYSEIIRTFAGIRPYIQSNDFIIEKSKASDNIIDLIGIDSPGIASAPAIAKYVEELIDLKYAIKNNYIKTRKAPVILNELSKDERNKFIQTNPLYGKIICRCEKISEGEIVDAIHSPIPATSIKAIKKRCRPGMGKCQGGFCQPLVFSILERELNLKEDEVLYDGKDSNIVLGGLENE